MIVIHEGNRYHVDANGWARLLGPVVVARPSPAPVVRVSVSRVPRRLALWGGR